MFRKVIGFFADLFFSGKNIQTQSYNRQVLEKIYPGFGTGWLPIDIESGGFVIGYFKEPEKQIFVKILPEPKDVVDFALYTRTNSTTGTKIRTFNTLDKTFDKSKPTKFIIHGWLARAKGRKSIKLKNNFLQKYDANVFIVDWDNISGNPFYPTAMTATLSVGKYCSTFLDHIINLDTDPKNIHLVGHSLGAHVAGFAARNVKNGKIGRITGLDPARPGFDEEHLVGGKLSQDMKIFAGGKLNKNDAEFVDVIHTCAGFLGYPTSLGHADFYPNGGIPPQPNCKRQAAELVEACSHGESWRYFTQSLSKSASFKAYKCPSWEDFQHGVKICQEDSVLMGDSTPPTARGNYYLTTLGVGDTWVPWKKRNS